MGSVLAIVASGVNFHRFRVRSALPLPTKDTAKFRAVAVPAACYGATYGDVGHGVQQFQPGGKAFRRSLLFKTPTTHSANSRRQRCL